MPSWSACSAVMGLMLLVSSIAASSLPSRRLRKYVQYSDPVSSIAFSWCYAYSRVRGQSSAGKIEVRSNGSAEVLMEFAGKGGLA